jgi:hypothetical protein
MARLLVAAIAASLAAALLGCGDGEDGDKGGAGSEAPSGYAARKAAYIEETDGYCRRLSERIEAELEPYERRLGNPPRAAASARLVEVMAPRVEFEIRRVRSIVLPRRDVKEVLRFLSAWYDEVQRAKRDPVAFVEAEPPFPQAEALARRFGFEDCGEL